MGNRTLFCCIQYVQRTFGYYKNLCKNSQKNQPWNKGLATKSAVESATE